MLSRHWTYPSASAIALKALSNYFPCMNFIDQARIYVKAGDGGPGCISFRREKYVPKGGPDGGDGGRGGSVIIKADPRLNTLLPFQRNRTFKAKNGRPGMSKNMHGKSGEDLVVNVPPGTVVKDPETGRVLADLVEPGETFLAAKGGQGGKGNARFVTPTRQAPRYAQPGTPGEERWLLLELKLIADVGLVGPPNAGKSTLLSAVSAARPKIADYPFTTVTPNLGVVSLSGHRNVVMADIPGLIEGAHKGVGMGLDFLRHIERTKVLLYVIDVGTQGLDKAVEDFEVTRQELAQYGEELLHKPQAIALNKVDLLDDKALDKALLVFKKYSLPVYAISAAARRNLDVLMEGLYSMIYNSDKKV